MIRVVVVDGFSSGKFVAQRLREAGCVLMHIASSGTLDSDFYKGFDHSIYEQMLVNTDLAVTQASVVRFKAQFIIAGAESGVLLADELSERLQLPYRNDFARSLARRNKYDMIQCIAHGQLPAPRQFIAGTWALAEAWIKLQRRFPVVIKPLESTGSDSVFICDDLHDCETAVGELLGTTNRLNRPNTQVLIQEYLAGLEYVVNMVSQDGQQVVTEVVRHQKQRTQGGSILHDIDELISVESAVYPVLVDYTCAVLRCLGIRNGPSHAEVMFTEEGPKLVEIVACTDDNLRPGVSRQTTGLGQLDAVALSITSPEIFAQLLTQPDDYRLLQHTSSVGLINRAAGRFDNELFLTELLKLESFFDVVFHVENGQRLGVTQDVASQPGTVYLVHADPLVIAADYRRIRILEIQGVYLVAG
ncbi:ATP-grasp domain-containing protein [Pseudomonas kairouanensis]|uniref:ATP-grasp domain-containing protein n=1 Tax=Pseudomonas kairouanensis TaxID=2293832 RepID=A0A4Z0AK87_9PSED|nr:ATP-grasp domain-containing protein [Pseudomonas kairouanensis]TFY86820.1 ATP-grasp domain-containing protein [Pseudomonas kairouanensis]